MQREEYIINIRTYKCESYKIFIKLLPDDSRYCNLGQFISRLVCVFFSREERQIVVWSSLLLQTDSPHRIKSINHSVNILFCVLSNFMSAAVCHLRRYQSSNFPVTTQQKSVVGRQGSVVHIVQKICVFFVVCSSKLKSVHIGIIQMYYI